MIWDWYHLSGKTLQYRRPRSIKGARDELTKIVEGRDRYVILLRARHFDVRGYLKQPYLRIIVCDDELQ